MANRRFIAALLVLAVLVSFGFLTCDHVRRHDCAGENCPVCCFIAQMEYALRGLCLLLAALFMDLLTRDGLRGRVSSRRVRVPVSLDLIALNVRMND